jgi:hypothetical protein
MTTTIDAAQAAAPDLSRGRLYAMRVGYPLMGVGRALVKWSTSQTSTRCRSTKASPGARCSHRQLRSRARWNRRLAARDRSLDAIPAL